MRYLGSRINALVNAEDRWLCERVAQGLQSTTTARPREDAGKVASGEEWEAGRLRVELEEALAAIARTAPKSTLVGDFPRLQNGAIRQITGMTVRFDA